MIALMIVGLCALWGWAGYELCQSRHKQNGTEVDPWSFLVPDHLPDDWSAKV